MRNISLDSILLFALVIPFIMTYRLSQSETPPYWLFGLIFLGLFLYIVSDVVSLKKEVVGRMKQTLLWFLIFVTIGSAFSAAIVVRHKTSPVYNIHDITLQLESAIQFFLQGKNPYAVTYFGTPLEKWHYSETEVNPALYHFVMEPFYLLFSLPFYFLSITLFGFFDGRLPLVFLFLVLLILAAKLVKDKKQQLLFLTLLAFNPAMLGYTLEGRSDVFMFAFLFAGLYVLQRGKLLLASIPIALAFTIKQSAWPILPFYVAFLFFKTDRLITTLKLLLPFIAIFGLISIPFFLWDQKAFLDSTILYLSGNTPHSYPISGYGLGRLLPYYQFHLWQILIGTPLLIVLIKFLKKKPTVARLVLTYGIFLFVVWYLSRYFNNSHLGYLSMVFISAYFWPTNER